MWCLCFARNKVQQVWAFLHLAFSAFFFQSWCGIQPCKQLQGRHNHHLEANFWVSFLMVNPPLSHGPSQTNQYGSSVPGHQCLWAFRGCSKTAVYWWAKISVVSGCRPMDPCWRFQLDTLADGPFGQYGKFQSNGSFQSVYYWFRGDRCTTTKPGLHLVQQATPTSFLKTGSGLHFSRMDKQLSNNSAWGTWSDGLWSYTYNANLQGHPPTTTPLSVWIILVQISMPETHGSTALGWQHQQPAQPNSEFSS